MPENTAQGSWALTIPDNATDTVSGSEISDMGYKGSMQQILTKNTGQYVICEFLIGSQTIVRKEGILYHVGVSYLTIFAPDTGNYTVCDFYTLKFVTFVSDPKRRVTPNYVPALPIGMNERV